MRIGGSRRSSFQQFPETYDRESPAPFKETSNKFNNREGFSIEDIFKKDLDFNDDHELGDLPSLSISDNSNSMLDEPPKLTLCKGKGDLKDDDDSLSSRSHRDQSSLHEKESLKREERQRILRLMQGLDELLVETPTNAEKKPSVQTETADINRINNENSTSQKLFIAKTEEEKRKIRSLMQGLDLLLVDTPPSSGKPTSAFNEGEEGKHEKKDHKNRAIPAIQSVTSGQTTVLAGTNEAKKADGFISPGTPSRTPRTAYQATIVESPPTISLEASVSSSSLEENFKTMMTTRSPDDAQDRTEHNTKQEGQPVKPESCVKMGASEEKQIMNDPSLQLLGHETQPSGVKQCNSSGTMHHQTETKYTSDTQSSTSQTLSPQGSQSSSDPSDTGHRHDKSNRLPVANLGDNEALVAFRNRIISASDSQDKSQEKRTTSENQKMEDEASVQHLSGTTLDSMPKPKPMYHQNITEVERAMRIQSTNPDKGAFHQWKTDGTGIDPSLAATPPQQPWNPVAYSPGIQPMQAPISDFAPQHDGRQEYMYTHLPVQGPGGNPQQMRQGQTHSVGRPTSTITASAQYSHQQLPRPKSAIPGQFYSAYDASRYAESPAQQSYQQHHVETRHQFLPPLQPITPRLQPMPESYTNPASDYYNHMYGGKNHAGRPMQSMTPQPYNRQVSSLEVRSVRTDPSAPQPPGSARKVLARSVESQEAQNHHGRTYHDENLASTPVANPKNSRYHRGGRFRDDQRKKEPTPNFKTLEEKVEEMNARRRKERVEDDTTVATTTFTNGTNNTFSSGESSDESEAEYFEENLGAAILQTAWNAIPSFTNCVATTKGVVENVHAKAQRACTVNGRPGGSARKQKSRMKKTGNKNKRRKSTSAINGALVKTSGKVMYMCGNDDPKVLKKIDSKTGLPYF